MYSFVPVYNPGYGNSSCTTTNAISALIDTNTGSLRIEFTGYSGPPNASGTPSVQRTIVASFRKPSPLDFLWYTDHEMEDPQLNSSCAGEKYYYQYTGSSNPPSSCEINWITGDKMSGPMYTNDQYLIYSGASPVFGRAAARTRSRAVRRKRASASVTIQRAQLQRPGRGAGAKGAASAECLEHPAMADATASGDVFTGTTTINLNGGSATISNCRGHDLIRIVHLGVGEPDGDEPAVDHLRQEWDQLPLDLFRLDVREELRRLLLRRLWRCLRPRQLHPAAHDRLRPRHHHHGQHHRLSSPGITTTTDASGNPTGGATLGLVAGDFVRVMHASGVTPTAVTIDAAILTLAHSFMVDNYGTDSAPTAPTLTVHGAIAQRYRGIVGTVAGAGYVKNYFYDDRLKVLLPPFLFSLSTAGWQVSRETLCTPNSNSSSSVSCAYQGS